MATTWDRVRLVPFVLVKGSEGVFAERALDRLLVQAREQDPEVEITRLEAAAYEPGALTYLASPSLFGEQRAIVVSGAESMTDAFLADALAYIEQPEPDVWLIVRHGGGNRGKKLLDALAKAGEVVACEPLKRDSDKAEFVKNDLQAAGRQIEREAVQALIDAVGSDLRELDAAVRQLVADTTGRITVALVNQYYGGRVEATGFKVADAAVAGHAGEAVSLARHAIATGTPPVPLVAALAVKLRTLVKVGAARGRGMSAGDVGIAPWQFDRAARELRGWSPEALAEAIMAVAQADAEVKGASRDPDFAIERALLRVAAARNRG
ncbi:MAG: DNA polymerase III subunit delta [bacterium]|nr:DNA polymerase III subunit delta [bacterium]